jgi:hypothetical protein
MLIEGNGEIQGTAEADFVLFLLLQSATPLEGPGKIYDAGTQSALC